MKLYTEEEIRKFFTEKYDEGLPIDELIEILTPIELPTDDGIKKIMEFDDMEFDEFDPYHVSHLDGAIWMRDKIQGGNK